MNLNIILFYKLYLKINIIMILNIYCIIINKDKYK